MGLVAVGPDRKDVVVSIYLAWALKHTLVGSVPLWDYLDPLRYEPGECRGWFSCNPAIGLALADDPRFRRGVNLFFHPGYPVSYREKAVPGVQVSLDRGATRAEVDIDFISGAFPVGLWNGHLGFGNSVVSGHMAAYLRKWGRLRLK